MKNVPKKKDFKDVKKEIEEEMIKKILDYLTTGDIEALSQNNKPNSYMNAYTAAQVYADIGDSESQRLFNYHNEKIRAFILECKDKVSVVSNSYIIDAFIQNTKNISFLIYWMNRVFCYLDRFYTKAKKHEDFFNIFRNNIFIEVNKLIYEDRRGNRESRQRVKIVMKTIKDLDYEFPKIVKENNNIVWIQDKPNENKNTETKNQIQNDWYDNYFEKETRNFATEKGNTDIQAMSAPEYILSQLKYLDEEYERQKEFINPIFHDRINKINYQCLIGNHMKTIADMDTGINKMLETKNDAQLTQLYKLFKLFPDSLKEITEKFQPYIKSRGNAIYENKELSKDPKKFIPELISLKKEMDKLVLECFENNTEFQDVKNKAFSLFMKKDVYAKQLSNYTDHCMRSGFKGKSQDEIERTLNDIIDLFKCLNSKLVFQNETNKKMSERLIKKQSLSSLSERLFITKLKQEAGVTYVSKMQEMMNDLEKNKTETENYKLSPHKGAPNGIKLDITVISQSAWEISKKAMELIELPPSLLHLEKAGKLTLGKIAELCGCQPSTIINDIQGLVFNPTFNPHGQADKGIIIGTFNAQTKEFKETDEISINMNFVSSRVKIQTIPLAQKKSASEVKQAEIEEAQIIKRYQDNILQATLTRIMKSRIGQETTHVWLVNEAAKQIDLFKAQPQQIKENIEKLIEKNVIKRNEKNRTCYDYIA